MIDTAEVVAKRYGITREQQDEYGLQSQLRTAAGQQAGRFDDEIVPLTTTKLAFDKKTGDIYYGDVGQNKWEEINFEPASSNGGINYGRRIMEANHCYDPKENCPQKGLTKPIIEYPNDANYKEDIEELIDWTFPTTEGDEINLKFIKETEEEE